MKLEIEITEEEIRSALERKVRSAIADQTSQWGTDKYIREAVSAEWKNSVNSMIDELLGNSDALREKISDEITRKIRAQLSVAIRKDAK